MKPEVLEQAKSPCTGKCGGGGGGGCCFWCSCNGGELALFNCNNDSAANSRYSG